MKYVTFVRTVNLIKARLKKILSLIEDISKEPTDSEDKVEFDPAPLDKVALQRLVVFQAEVKLKQAEFDKNLKRLIDVSTLPSDYDENTVINAQDEIHDQCANILCKIQLLLEKPDNNDTLSSHSHSSDVPTNTAVRLPKIELKHFNGDSHSWISFINLFDTTIHKNTSLSPVAKFQYLLGSLSGDALNLVKSLPITDANYIIAYETLRNRYHSVRRLTSLHLNKIIDLPNITLSPLKNLRTFLNVFNENTQALKALNCNVVENNPLLSTLLLRKMDTELRSKFESSRVDAQSIPMVDEIIKMLNNECIHAEDASLHCFDSKSVRHTPHAPNTSTKAQSVRYENRSLTLVATDEPQSSAINYPCFGCSKTGHKIYNCQTFKSKTPQERHKLVKNHHRCVCCLGNHEIKNCRSKFSCSKCQRKHHTLLHFDSLTNEKSHATPAAISCSKPASEPPQNFVGLSTDYSLPPTSSTVLLATVLVKLATNDGTQHVFRALVDSCSQCDFISERAAQLLGVRRMKSHLYINGIAQSQTSSKGMTSLNIETLNGVTISKNHPMLILDKITSNLPKEPLSPEIFELVKGYTLADPTFHLSGPIDALLGASLFPLIYMGENYPLGPNLPFVMNTVFGYTLMGTAPCLETTQTQPTSSGTTLLTISDLELHSAIQRFWQQEEPPTHKKMSEEEILCDEHFSKTHTRNSDGRYIVELPFKSDPSLLGDSKNGAKIRFKALENKFNSQPLFKKAYVEFMDDYSHSGHMIKCDLALDKTPHYFLPHHGVLKDSSSTTKLRTVFDASSKTSTGVSLNDILLTGPKLQTNIFDILFSFRRHNIVFSCDIRQMYRMVMVAPDNQRYQLIMWRDKPNSPLDVYKLTTVTYGMNCSPYLALRTLRQLADDEGEHFPAAAQVLKNNTYVDDIIVGAENEEKALALQDQLIQLLRKGGFELRKWTSNSPSLLGLLPSNHHEIPKFLKTSDQPFYSILGLFWSSSLDCFSYNFKMNLSCVTTKRQILSLIAQISYDPCGFLSPVTMWAKIFMQLLWTKGLSWDDSLPQDLIDKWNSFATQLDLISDIQLPRSLHISQSGILQIHGFSDASESGYSAVVYVRCIDENNSVTVRQLISKTRVAPLKKISLPRLELCGSHLLAKLIAYCLTLLTPHYDVDRLFAWCDSTIVLNWLQTPPYRLKTYVANRVAEIQELVPSHVWSHIRSQENPADCASRGILPVDLKTHPLWWTGPQWMTNSTLDWPESIVLPLNPDVLEEIKPEEVTALHSTEDSPFDFLRFSSWSKLVRVLSYVRRFISNLRQPATQRKFDDLSAKELNSSSLQICKIVQLSTFPEEIKCLQTSKPCSTKVQRLTPFIDEHGLIRVGGRLKHSALDFDVKHQIILPKHHPAVTLLVDYYHLKYLHAPPQLLQSLLTQKFWILSARSVIRSRIFKCIKCFRAKPRNTSPLMGDLPAPRTTPSRPFSDTGIDFCGPFIAKAYNLRALRTFKLYVCIFVCMSTKAVHLEVCSDLSSEAFIATLTRFVSRRGLCKRIYCDNGTNFVGANSALKKIISEYSAENSIDFHFNPPSSPHQGGLWESAVKNMKYHLRRVVGDTILTVEEYTTVITKIEALMNSRPLVPLSSDPSDLSALTPGHFLIGAPLTTVPEPDVSETPVNRLKRWQRLQAFTQAIWKRWSRDYIHTLQQKGKWIQRNKNLQIGDLVLIEDNSSPPLSWPLARIVSVFPGSDNVVRVVRLRTKNGFLTRPAVKIFPLPID